MKFKLTRFHNVSFFCCDVKAVHASAAVIEIVVKKTRCCVVLLGVLKEINAMLHRFVRCF